MKYILGLLTSTLLLNCQIVKPYQKEYLNDEDMQMTSSLIKTYEANYQSYREASTVINAGKTGGGCGCN